MEREKENKLSRCKVIFAVKLKACSLEIKGKALEGEEKKTHNRSFEQLIKFAVDTAAARGLMSNPSKL